MGEVAEPWGADQHSSSTMPQKQNPEISEWLEGLARLGRGYAMSLLDQVHGVRRQRRHGNTRAVRPGFDQQEKSDMNKRGVFVMPAVRERLAAQGIGCCPRDTLITIVILDKSASADAIQNLF